MTIISDRGQKRKRQGGDGITKGSERSSTAFRRNGSDHSKIKPRQLSEPKRLESTMSSEEEGEEDEDEDEDEDNADLEDSYLRRHASTGVATSDIASSLREDSEDETSDAEPPPHETHTASGQTRPSKTSSKGKHVPPNESPAQRDARTIFVGNIPIAVVKSKALLKKLKLHFHARVTGSKIESLRFRSIPFAAPTTDIPTGETNNSANSKQRHRKQRAARRREVTATDGRSQSDGGDDGDSDMSEDGGPKKAKKPALTPAQRKRVAFFKGEFHQEVDTVNAYIVFAYPGDSPDEKLGENNTQLHPFEAARLAVELCDGTIFLEKTIRVDRVGQWRVGAGADAGESGTRDPHLTLFVGNLDFAAKEEDLRVWFEGVINQEMGPPGEDNSDDESEAAESEDDEDDERDGGEEGPGGTRKKPRVEKRSGWVRSVRIIRDRDTLLGKGFAYVRFSDRECVDEILRLEPSQVKFAKRKLRIQRCKVNPTTSMKPLPVSKPKSPRAFSGHKATKAAPSRSSPVPKGDPSLGNQLAGLSKDERKAAKAANIDRVKRRLAKKKAKASQENFKGGKVRDRHRRREKSEKNKPKGKGKPVNKARIRSENSEARKNMKK